MRIVIESTDGGWTVAQSNGDSVWPTTTYPDSRLAIARVLQLLDLGPVAPQTHPERVCIGTIDYRPPPPKLAPSPPGPEREGP